MCAVFYGDDADPNGGGRCYPCYHPGLGLDPSHGRIGVVNGWWVERRRKIEAWKHDEAVRMLDWSF